MIHLRTNTQVKTQTITFWEKKQKTKVHTTKSWPSTYTKQPSSLDQSINFLHNPPISTELKPFLSFLSSFFFLIWYTPFTETPPTSLFLEPLSQWASGNTWTLLCGTDRVTWNHTWYRPRITQPLSLPSIYIPLITFQPNNSVIRYRTQVPKKKNPSTLHHWKFS